MKKYLLVIVVFLLGMRVYANPLPPPTIRISEFTFDAERKWALELLLEHQVDSMKIIISGDTFLINNYVETLNYLVVIYGDDFSTESTFNPLGDIITILFKLTHYYDEWGFKTLAYGNHPQSIIQAPKAGQSITLCSYQDFPPEGENYHIYTLDKTPTLGQKNDAGGTLGTMRGKIYDVNSHPLTNAVLAFNGNRLYIDDSGTYSVYIYAGRYSFPYIRIPGWKNVPIKPISYEIYPDSTINRDIFLLDNIYTSIQDIKKEEKSPIRFFPNPVSSGKLHYEIDLPILSGNMSLSIFSTDGKLVKSHKITNSIGEIEMAQTAGIYQIVLKMDNRVISTKSIMVE